MEVIRHGKYKKSAVEPIIKNEMRMFQNEQITALLNFILSGIVSDISKSRKFQ
jgi:hypothetical protein